MKNKNKMIINKIKEREKYINVKLQKVFFKCYQTKKKKFIFY